MSTNSSMTGIGGNRPDYVASGLLEDRLKKAPSERQRVDVAAATLLALIPKLPEHKAEDTSPEMEATSHRLGLLLELVKDHFKV